MRMWKLDPAMMCDKHLIGEHAEMHMFLGAIMKGKSIKGYIDGGLVEPKNIQVRHDQLADEMVLRKINHRSPMPDLPLSVLRSPRQGFVNRVKSMVDLMQRCPQCKAKITKKIFG